MNIGGGSSVIARVSPKITNRTSQVIVHRLFQACNIKVLAMQSTRNTDYDLFHLPHNGISFARSQYSWFLRAL